MYGSLCQQLSVRVSRTGGMVGLLCPNFQHFVRLSMLDLEIWHEGPADTRMAAKELRSLRFLLQSLPPITSLRLKGIHWGDAAMGTSNTHFPSVHTLNIRDREGEV
jgi:hypothetical protein